MIKAGHNPGLYRERLSHLRRLLCDDAEDSGPEVHAGSRFQSAGIPAALATSAGTFTGASVSAGPSSHLRTSPSPRRIPTSPAPTNSSPPFTPSSPKPPTPTPT